MAADTPPVPEENAEEIIDLTELIERGASAPAPDLDAHIQNLNAQPEGEDAEIEALLAQMDAGDGSAVSPGPAAPLDGPAAPAPSGTVDPHEQLDMSEMGDIDDLLASLDIPPQPRESAPADASPSAPESPAPGPADEDISQSLDKAMDELLGGTPPRTPQPAAAPAAAAAPSAGAGPSVEELLAAATAPAASVPDLDADLDALLNETATAAPAPAASGAPDLDADLDALLNETTAATPDAPDPDSLLNAPDADVPAPGEPAESAPEAPAAMAAEAPAPDAAPVPDMDSALTEAMARPAAAPEDDAVPPADAMPPVAEAAPEPDPAMEAPAQPDAPAAAGEQDMADAPENAAEPAPEDAPDPVDSPVDAPVDAPAPAASFSAEAESLAALAGTLGERLRQCEADLAAARARIEALEHSTADSISLGDLLREGSPLHNGFAALIASSVGQALKDTPLPACLPGSVEERLNALEAHDKSLLARMDALESRLDGLEPRFNEEVGKAAAGAVARILREEISRLAGG